MNLFLTVWAPFVGFFPLLSVDGFHPCTCDGTRTPQHWWHHCSDVSLRAINNKNVADLQLPAAYLVGILSSDRDDVPDLQHALSQHFGSIFIEGCDNIDDVDLSATFAYKFSKATGMLQLIRSPEVKDGDCGFEAPRWVPIVKDMETVLISNGWSFLDPDENEPLSSYDIDAANLEGTYQPKWGALLDDNGSSSACILSRLGFDLTPLTSEQVLEAAATLDQQTRHSLLEGGTDPPNLKLTYNGISFQGSSAQSDLEEGIFVCAIGGLPLFSTLDLSPSTATSGWLSFRRSLSEDHVILVHPDDSSTTPDQRVEVICAKSQCHLGHYFGAGEGFCINASALSFIKTKSVVGDFCVSSPPVPIAVQHPVSWRALDDVSSSSSDLRKEQLRNLLLDVIVSTEQVALGAGCFWHVEEALRRLPGIVQTTVGFAGGTMSFPTYEDVCRGDSGHAEVVLVEYDSTVLSTTILIDCFLAMHDPTKVRAHGKHASGTGQYRSCIVFGNSKLKNVIEEVLAGCQSQLQRQIGTEVIHIQPEGGVGNWFWRAEARHQRHDEQRHPEADVSTLSCIDWLLHYGKRSQSIWGSATTMNSYVE